MGLFFLCLLSLVVCCVCASWGLVGGVFDMWIVDASIWQQPGFLGLLSFVFCSGPAAALIVVVVGLCVFVVFVECL